MGTSQHILTTRIIDRTKRTPSGELANRIGKKPPASSNPKRKTVGELLGVSACRSNGVPSSVLQSRSVTPPAGSLHSLEQESRRRSLVGGIAFVRWASMRARAARCTSHARSLPRPLSSVCWFRASTTPTAAPCLRVSRGRCPRTLRRGWACGPALAPPA